MVENNEFIKYAPIILVVLIFLLKNQFFITPLQLQKKLKEFSDEIEKKYVTRRECVEHKGNTEKRLDEIIRSVNEIKNYLIGIVERK